MAPGAAAKSRRSTSSVESSWTSQWSARLAAFLSRGRGNGDPDVIACHEALSYWRVRRSIDAEREHLAEAHVPGAVATAILAKRSETRAFR